MLTTALFSFLYHLASYEAGGEALVHCGMMESLLAVVSWAGKVPDHVTVSAAWGGGLLGRRRDVVGRGWNTLLPSTDRGARSVGGERVGWTERLMRRVRVKRCLSVGLHGP